MLDQAYRLVRATAAVLRGANQQVCKILPENALIVLEGANEDGKTVNVRWGVDRFWMFARDVADRCLRVTQSKSAPIPESRQLTAGPAEHSLAALHSELLRKEY